MNTRRYPRTGIPNRAEFRCRECGLIFPTGERASTDRRRHPLSYRTCRACHVEVWGREQPRA